ncbi:MAG: hypothetical protein IKQ62_04255 [Bacteroidaceae bacterium]|nr:hypothetical protein [Bacteroidaceae bacterium]
MKYLYSVLSAWLLAGSLQAQQLAFPGAEGYGAYASGGRGCQVVHVTNLNAAGTGSLADAVSQSNRFVVFDVGGVIDITGKSITIASNITIAGQTAPGEGITIYGGRVIASKSKNVIMRYIRMRGGKSVNSSKCTLTLDECQNFIMDHCSVSWGPWDNVHIKDANNVTWQYCINSEGIEPQRFGSITDGTRNWTIHHCLWADNKSRNPKMKCYLQYYNNVVYNYGMGIIGGHSAADNYQDVMNNYFIAGPNGSAKYFDDWTATDHLYSTGNYFDGNCDGVLNGTLITDYNSATPMTNPNFKTTHPMNVETAAQAYATVVEHVGASRVRDVHDRRILEQLTSLGKKGSFIANEEELGGIGRVAGGPRPTDADNDGMADDWERENGLNTSVNDANAYTLGGGYTNIEHYVNSLAQKTSFLMYPYNLEASLLTATKVQLKWMLEKNDDAQNVVVEQSEDGRTFTEIKRLSSTATQTTVDGLIADKVYFFRAKVIGKDGKESNYSDVVSINDEYMRPAGGTRAGVNPFVPQADKLYRIISYASIPYNSGTTLNGTPKYLTFNSNGTLGTTESFQWDEAALLWVITPVEGGVNIQNYGSKKYIAAVNTSIASTDRIGTSDTPTLLTINYTGDQTPAQSRMSGNVSMYRINSLSNHGYQIRARGFADDWFWGSGTFDRADMVFTFVEIDASLIKMFLLNKALDDAQKLAKNAKAEVTLGYPTQAITDLMNVVAEVQTFSQNIDETTAEEDIDTQVTKLKLAMEEFKKTCIYTFEGFSTDVAYCIYSYGETSNASASTATTSIKRRYLYAVKNQSSEKDGLVYRIGLSDNDINGGKTDAYMTDPAALWAFESAENDYVTARNLSDGQYLQIERELSVQPVTIHPTYAKQDNGKMAFFMDATAEGKRLFNVGAPDADGKGGPLEFFSLHADRTRLRWVIEETAVEVSFPTGISSPNFTRQPSVRYFTLEGIELTARPSNGIYLESVTQPDGSVKTRKVLAQ